MALNCTVTCLHVAGLPVTMKRYISSTEKVLVHDVSVVSWLFVALLKVGGVLELILSPVTGCALSSNAV